MDKKTETTKEVAQTLTFNNKLVKGGKIVIDRNALVSSIQNEHRSYAAHTCEINDQKSFSLPEIEANFPSGFGINVVLYLKDNAKGEGKKEKLTL